MKKKAKASALASIVFCFAVPGTFAQPEEDRDWIPLKDAGVLGRWLRPHRDYCEGKCTVGTENIESAPFISNPAKLGKQSIFVSLVGLYVSPKMLNALAGSQHLRNLYVSNTNFDDEDCKTITSCPNLYSIDVSWDNITNAGLQELAKLDHLHIIKLRGITVTPEMAKTLASMRNLDYLDISETDMQSVLNVLSTKGFSNLRTLAVQNMDFSKFKFQQSLDWPKLRTLAIDQSKLNENDNLLNLVVGLPAFRMVRAFKLNEQDRKFVRAYSKKHSVTVFEEQYMKGR